MDAGFRIALGVLYFLVGFVWIRRSQRDEANSAAPISLFIPPEPQSDIERVARSRAGILYIAFGVYYILFAIFFRR
jgi:hypothetical protein